MVSLAQAIISLTTVRQALRLVERILKMSIVLQRIRVRGLDLNMAPSGINMQSGDIFKVTLTYDGSNLFESVTDTSTGANFTHTYTGINLPSIVGANTAFVGFGGSTGAYTMNAYLNSWTYMVNTPIDASIENSAMNERTIRSETGQSISSS